MTETTDTTTPLAVLQRLRDAINAHDVDALAGCFAPGFRGEHPAYPDSAFVGNENVGTNWGQIFARIPDISFELVRTCSGGDLVWAEVAQRGTMPDGSPHHMRGVVVCTVADGQMTDNHLYMQPVHEGMPPMA